MTVTANAPSLPTTATTDAYPIRAFPSVEAGKEFIRQFLREPHNAISFALDNLETFEVADFLSDYRDGNDLTPWLDAWHQDRAA